MFKIPFTNLSFGNSGEFEENQSTPRPISFGSFFGGLRPGSELQTFKISVASLFAVYRMNSDIRNCVRELAQNTGKSGHMYVNLADTEKEISDAEKNELSEIFNCSESTHKTFKSLLARTVRDMEVTGNAYWVILRNDGGKALGFQPADPRTMAIIADETGLIHSYIQRVIGKEVKEYKPEDIVHFKGEDDPNHEVFGMGKLEPIIWEARTDNAAMVSNYKFFENNAVPSALYILDEKIPKDKLKLKFDEIKKHFGGAANYKKAGAIVGVKDIKMLNITQKDMEFLAGRKFSTEKICASFGVPMFKLGYTEKVNNNNGTELLKTFFEDTIDPIETMIQENITMQFLIREGYQIAFLFSAHQFTNAKEIEDRVNALYKSGLVTLRQAKQRMGDEITPEDEKQENFDSYIIHQGASAVLLEDVGTDPDIDFDEDDS
jgi:HK97 family phage portal protein